MTDWRRGKGLPSPEEAARMCVLLQTTPEDILLHEGKDEKETAKCQEDIKRVRELMAQAGAENAPDPKIEGAGIDRTIVDFLSTASAEETMAVQQFIEFLESKRAKNEA